MLYRMKKKTLQKIEDILSFLFFFFFVMVFLFAESPFASFLCFVAAIGVGVITVFIEVEKEKRIF